MNTATAPTNPYPDVSPPPGVSVAGDWGDEEPCRIIYGQRHDIGAVVIGAWDRSSQQTDEREICVHGGHPDNPLSAAEAHAFAAALIAAAEDLERADAEGWNRSA
jgi:hypothetical protein